MDEPVADDWPPARWSTRVGAWLIDIVLVVVVVGVVGALFEVGPDLVWPGDPLAIVEDGVLLFAYWTLFDANTGRSPGKLVLDVQVIGEDGTAPSLPAAAVESFGKAFLLPVDLVVGLIAMPGRRLRLFNRLSGTRVVRVDVRRQRSRRPSAVEA